MHDIFNCHCGPLGCECRSWDRLPSFFPSEHYMLNRSMDVTVGQGIVRDAGLEPVDMRRYFDHHQDLYFEFPLWLTADLCGVQHPSHLPRLVPDTWDPFDLTTHYRQLSPEKDDAEEPYFRSPPCMSISTLKRCAHMPKIRASFVGKGPLPHPSIGSFGGVPPPPPPTVHPDGWHIRTSGYVDSLASHPFMTRNAESIGYRTQDIDTSVAGSIYELQDRPRGSRELSMDRHRGNFLRAFAQRMVS